MNQWTGDHLVASLFLQPLLLLHRLGCRASSLLLGSTRCRFGLFVLLTASDVDLFGFAQINLTLNLKTDEELDFNQICRLLWAPACIKVFTSFLLARIQCSLISLRFFSCSL